MEELSRILFDVGFGLEREWREYLPRPQVLG